MSHRGEGKGVGREGAKREGVMSEILLVDLRILLLESIVQPLFSPRRRLWNIRDISSVNMDVYLLPPTTEEI